MSRTHRIKLLSDLRVLQQLTLSRTHGNTHQERLESFYRGQAKDYDSFRERLLHGRPHLMDALQFPKDGVWIDLGCGTGQNMTLAGDKIDRLSEVHLVDLSESLLAVAKGRAADRVAGVDSNVSIATHLADATTFELGAGRADVVTFSYSLTMIPDWFAAIENAMRLLRPGGLLGVTDFYISRKHAVAGLKQHGFCTRTFWQTWFSLDNVFLSPDHLPMISRLTSQVHLEEGRGRVPYLPLVRAPYYVFVGNKPFG